MTERLKQNNQRTLEQDRATYAWNCVSDVKDSAFAGEYGSLARSAAADIRDNGFGPTLAFWYAKGYEKGDVKDGENQHAQLLHDVDEWVLKRLEEDGDIDAEDRENGLLKWITEKATSDQYRRARSEAIALLVWIKRFAEAELGTTESL